MAGPRWAALRRGLLMVSVPMVAFLLGCPQPMECLRCEGFSLVGTFEDARISECSGLVSSRNNPGILWAHNDSGDVPRLFAVQEDGTLRGVYDLAGAQAVDWEDMARGPCAGGGAADCLYVGDIGDNARTRASIHVYRVAEPVVPQAGAPETATLQNLERFECVYPDGAQDAEILLVDPDTGIPYIVTKAVSPNTNVYRFPGTPVGGVTVVLEKVTTLTARALLTGGDAAADGSRVVLRDYVAAYDYPRAALGSFADIFSQNPCLLSLAPEAQGESLAMGPSGLELFTASEGQGAPIHKSICELP